MPGARSGSRDASRWAARGTTTQRGLGSTHQKLRARLMAQLATLPARTCRRCGQPMVHPDRCCGGNCPRCHLDLGHGLARALGGDGSDSDLEHAGHNRADGARLAARLRTARRAASRLPRW